MLHFKANREKLRECGQTCDCPLQLFNVDWWTLWCQDRLGLTGKDMQVRPSCVYTGDGKTAIKKSPSSCQNKLFSNSP